MPKNTSWLSQLQKYVANITVSPAPHALKAAAQAMLGQMTADPNVGFNTDATDHLAHAIAALPGDVGCHLDLIRLLHGESVQQTRHRRANLAAVLRDIKRRLVRAPVATDFVANHPIHAFALPYWGGVAAWSAGSAKRAQHRKGYWDDRVNQIDALRAAVSRHPDVPVTHTLLRVAGLYRLAVLLNAEQLASLADEARVDRRRLYRTSGWWTPARVVDSYAKDCRAAGVTLSSSALTALGGQSSSLRIYARRHFSNFRKFQLAVIERHPDIRPPARPVAADGTWLDSWSEVAAYHAIIEALPNVQVDPHVVLPGESSRSMRSGDFLINGSVWVEVLGVSRDDMKTPTSKRQKKYAAQWTAKFARYTALGVKPVVIEPADIHDPHRLAERIGEIAHQLGTVPPPVPQPTIRTVRAKGTWTFEALCQAVAELTGATGAMPTYGALTSAGYGHAAQLLRAPGERQRVVNALGLHDPNCKGIWTRTRVVDELSAWVRVHGNFATKAELKRAGHGRLCSAIDRLWVGDHAGLRTAVEVGSSVPLPARRRANGSLDTPAQLVAALKPLADALGRMPSCKEAIQAGLSTAWARASRSIGAAAMARLLSVRSTGPRRRSRTEMLDEFAELAASASPARLTTTMIRDAMGAGGLARLRRCGGIASVREAIGRASDVDGRAA